MLRLKAENVRRVRAGLAVFACAVASFAPAHASSAPCANPVDVAGQGPSCGKPGAWSIPLRDGTILHSHGPDAAPPSHFGILMLTDAQPADPPCATGVQGRAHLVYARPANGTDRSAIMAPVLRQVAALANGQLRKQTRDRFGKAADYLFACTSGTITVSSAVLSTPSAYDNYSTIVSDLQKKGYTNTDEKYWVFYDDAVACGCLGQGNIEYDDRLAANNANMSSLSFALVYGPASDYLANFIAFGFMHESGHTMGAVQHSAPHASGGWHCNDGDDIMCYADGGSTSHYYEASGCRDRDYFDCGADDYFNPSPPAGSYLDTHWNLASPYNKFLRLGP